MRCAKQNDFRAAKVQFNCKMSHDENASFPICNFSFFRGSPENMEWDGGGDRFHLWNLLGVATLGGGSRPDLYVHAAAEEREGQRERQRRGTERSRGCSRLKFEHETPRSYLLHGTRSSACLYSTSCFA